MRTTGGFEFAVSKHGEFLHPDTWGRYQLESSERKVLSDALFRDCDADIRPEIQNDKLVATDAFIASLTEIEAKQLGLPNVCPAVIKITTDGLISNNSFKINYRLLRPEGRPFLGASVEGCLLHQGDTKQLILDPYFSIIKNIEDFNRLRIDDVNERLVKWGELQELLPENAIVEGSVASVTICRADRLTLDIKGGSVFDPLLIKPSNEKSWDIQSQSDVEYAIPKSKQQEFSQQFKKWQSAKSNYALGGSTYLVVPERVKDVLNVIKDYQQKPAEQRLAFVANPYQFINESLGESNNSADIENLFIETPDFISQRIEQIGEWNPKLCAYVVKRNSDWMTDEEPRYFIPFEDTLINLTLEEMKELLELVKSALDNEQDTIEFKNQTIAISLEVKNLLIRTLKPLEEDELSDGDANPIEAPILKDNIEDVDFEVIKKDPRPSISISPQRLKTTELFEHQTFGLHWLANHWQSGSIGALLADDMGLGKTIQSLTFLLGVKELMEANKYPNKPCLIVAPSGLLKNWKDEARIHLHEPGIGDLFEAYGDNIRKLKELSVLERNEKLASSDWVLTTYETLRDKIKYFISIDWGVTIFDEAQKIKNPVARVTEMAKSLSSDFTLMLTGTPVENELKDLWCIVDTAQPGLFGSLNYFHNEYAVPAEADQNFAQNLKALLVEKSQPPLMLRRMKADHIKGLPDKVIKEVPVVMPELQAEEYENIVRDSQLEKGIAGSVLQFIQKIRKASLIAEELDSSGITDGVIRRSARLQALIDILDDVAKANEKALIFCEDIQVQDYLAGYLQQRYQLENRPFKINGQVDGDARKRYVDKFQARPVNEFDVMILSPKAGGVGLTITAANHVIHLTRWWNPAVEDQSTDRAFRIGQKKTVHVYMPIAVHPKYGEYSFDMNLNRLLEKKRNLSLNALLPGTVTDSEFNELYTRTLG